MEKYSVKDLHEKQVFNLDSITLSEEEIINYAKLNDPLAFHIDKKAAEESMFKGFVSSGPHIFSAFHIKYWVPMFGETVICGLELNNWKFLRPIYANQPTHCVITIIHLHRNPARGHAVITWKYEFYTDKKEMVQTVEVTVMHKL
ncbi:MAG TPA: MaoC/PaaZ C-terminal domain-containing protein [Bacteroidia bacterium]|nr:MaoC/PaaZ C-terminal domain-containing protein [Bacteroidia bacterium]